MIRLSRFCTSFSFLIITKAKQKSFGYRSPPLEARAIASTRWHFCTNCSQWPAVAYEEVKNPEHPPTDDLCPEYVEKRKRKRCRWWEESASNRRLILQYPVNFLIASPSSPARGSTGKSLLGCPGRECRHTCEPVHQSFALSLSRVMSEGLAFDREENRSDDPGCIHKLLSRISLFFWLRARPRSVRDRTPYRQQTLGISWVAWSYPIVSVVSYMIVFSRAAIGSVNKVGKKHPHRNH